MQQPRIYTKHGWTLAALASGPAILRDKYKKNVKKIVDSFRKILLYFIGEGKLKSNTKKKLRKVCAPF
jgi:hypothetical protein